MFLNPDCGSATNFLLHVFLWRLGRYRVQLPLIGYAVMWTCLLTLTGGCITHWFVSWLIKLNWFVGWAAVCSHSAKSVRCEEKRTAAGGLKQAGSEEKKNEVNKRPRADRDWESNIVLLGVIRFWRRSEPQLRSGGIMGRVKALMLTPHKLNGLCNQLTHYVWSFLFLLTFLTQILADSG